MTSNPHPYSGEYTVKESFLEFLVPLAKDVPFAKELALNAAGRITDYSQSGSVETWKLGMTWQPINDLLFRATESRDIRAPNIANLFAGLSTGSTNVTDPFNNGATVFTRFSTLGNPDLVPERGTTFTGGLTFQPSWLNGLALSVDYYDIKTKDLISSYSQQQEVNYCYEGNTTLCSDIFRDPTGSIYLILEPVLNLNEAATEGIDLDVSYRTNVLGGALSTRLIGNHLITQSTTAVTPTGNIESQYANNLSYGSPGWLLTETTSYDRGPIGFDLTGRFVSSGLYQTTDLPGTISPAENQLPSNFTVDAGIRYTLKSVPGAPTLYLTITNVLNKAPPLIPGSLITSGQTNSALYDVMGRYFFGGVRMLF
ncbi:MAG: TonB-dependent receptor [Steroidobacteraceae bacterium]